MSLHDCLAALDLKNAKSKVQLEADRLALRVLRQPCASRDGRGVQSVAGAAYSISVGARPHTASFVLPLLSAFSLLVWRGGRFTISSDLHRRLHFATFIRSILY